MILFTSPDKRMSVLTKTLIEIQKYLEKSSKAHENFQKDLEEMLSPLHPYLDRDYPYHLFVKVDDPMNWLVTIIGTYNCKDEEFNNKKISVELVAYFDLGVVRFLKTPCSIKMARQVFVGRLEDRISDYLSERYLIKNQEPFYPPRIDFLIGHLKSLNLFYLEELLILLESILLVIPAPDHRNVDITFFLDQLLICLDNFEKSTSRKDLLIIFDTVKKVGELIEYPFDRIVLIKISLLLAIPRVEKISSYLHRSFRKLLEDLSILTPLTLDFLLSLLEEILWSSQDNPKSWEKAFTGFFVYHQEKCFNQVIGDFFKEMTSIDLTSSSSECAEVTSSNC